jgi:hypothetical protein
MEITGKLIQVLPEETGEGRNGTWKKQGFIIETEEQYPKKVCIIAWGDKIDLKTFQINEKVTASINIESREFNGRWYTDVKVWRLVKDSKDSTEKAGDSRFDNIPPGTEIPPAPEDNTTDDLPF